MLSRQRVNRRYKIVLILALCLLQDAEPQKNEGDSCEVQYTSSVGICTSSEKCRSAKDDLQFGGIQPTFCQHQFGQVPLVCCRDSTTILQPAGARPTEESGFDANKRVSERKCDQYSKAVKQIVDFIPLLPNPDPYNISSAKCDYIDLGLIVGGTNARLGEFPHMAAIGWANYEGGYTFNCGGALISKRHVLSAGHCTSDPNARDPEPVVVRLGDQNINTAVNDGANPIDVPIKFIHKHPDYKPPIKYHDIAIFELNTDVELSSNIRPACLWTSRQFDQDQNNMAIATGWGVVNPDTRQTSEELQKVSLNLIDDAPCDRLLVSLRSRKWWGVKEGQVCAGELRGGKDTCQGDSGSPLQKTSKDNYCIFHIIGITSFGGKCALSGRPGLYTRVSNYLDWIEGVVWPNE